MTTTPTTGSLPPIVCPPGCKHAAEMSRHDVEVDEDGILTVSHEVDFGEYAFGSVEQRLDGSPVRTCVTVTDLGPRDFWDSPDLVQLASNLLMVAATWLESSDSGQ